MANLQLIVGSLTLTTANTKIRDVLVAQGHTVTTKLHTATLDVTGVDGVVFGRAPFDVTYTDYSAVTKPILCLGRMFWPMLGWSTNNGAGFGSTDDVSPLYHLSPQHPIIVGQANPFQMWGVVSNWSYPTSAPSSISRIASPSIASPPDPLVSSLFAFEQSAALLSGKVAQRRQVGIGAANEEHLAALNTNGGTIIANALTWLGVSGGSTGTPLATPVPTVTLTHPTTSGGTNGSVVVSWPAVTGAASYDVEVATGLNQTSGFTLLQAGNTTRTYTHASLGVGDRTYGVTAKP